MRQAVLDPRGKRRYGDADEKLMNIVIQLETPTALIQKSMKLCIFHHEEQTGLRQQTGGCHRLYNSFPRVILPQI